ncbi:Spo11/DNA topoisomerase VI subunit A [Sphaerosporella brunnea]|uniref:DNA topoisomerase (ATP-hydrolyzing) n=1 Tax=Sphaerosporella brunnea TaxID=1250544 RepID=A0A5J5F6G9_9PEZI|nr:Spo11/DNA topoisomerase VI subunit A [Sphaerosporella brunnea]
MANFISAPPPTQDLVAPQTSLLTRITTLLTSLHTPLLAHQSPTLSIASRTTTLPTAHTLSFLTHPWRFSIYLLLLSYIHQLLLTNTTATKRDLFYRNPTLFRRQAVVDKAIDDLACTFGVRRGELHVVAAAKGLVVGGVTLVLTAGRRVECQDVATLIPPGVEGVEIREDVKWVLWVEKEAVFHSLAPLVGEDKLLVTGKGYPDIATRELLVRLAAAGRTVYALVDLDPHGLEIAEVVRRGSRSLSHETGLAVAGLRWLGIRREDVVGRMEGVVRLTARDREKAKSMLARPEGNGEMRVCLQQLLWWGVKAEIEILGDGVWEWVLRRVQEEEAK